jgi:hypothetical protein
VLQQGATAMERLFTPSIIPNKPRPRR